MAWSNPWCPGWLVDAELIWVDDQKMRIRGLEVVEGVTYGQT